MQHHGLFWQDRPGLKMYGQKLVVRLSQLILAVVLMFGNSSCGVVVEHEVEVYLPLEGDVIYAPQVQIEGETRDYPAGVERVVYLLNGGPETVAAHPPITEASNYGFSFTVTGLQPGLNEIIVRAYDPGGGSFGDTVKVRYIDAEVILDYTLGEGEYLAGEHISLARIEGGHVANPDECTSRHLHADASESITIDGNGPYVDQNPGACGFGAVVYLAGAE
ncbi:MAG: hypothetical protein HJJLKODD_02943 [Phycisphaerae bacterium]|nr:hypothetical protein [Phycisphaerae bacterium]